MEKEKNCIESFFENGEPYIKKFECSSLHKFKAKTIQDVLNSYILIEIEHNSQGAIYKCEKM